MVRFSFRPVRLAAAVVLFVSVAGCYLPGSFDAEIELSRNGFYKMSFDGYIVDVGLYDKLRKNELDPNTPEGRERIQLVLDDFKRDAGTKLVSYYGQGAFQVRWVKSGDLAKTKFVTFYRRNENMLSLTYDVEAATLTMRGKYLNRQDRERLAEMGLGMQGVLRVKTDGKVAEHNATKVTDDEGPISIYGWRIESIDDPAPKLVVNLR